ncbi:MAG TPA: hypothetical protein VFI37_14765 [Gaiellaceae bacterium]|jgi:hypothetical protein|nr:hypothetical protein [Gaiellaceae bacterium]
MKHRLVALLALAVAAMAITGSAFAFDCIRVSSSLQGLQQSTKSGNWLLFDFSSAGSVQRTFATAVGGDLPAEVASCVADEYATYDVSPYFALGIGVAGGRTEAGGSGVLAWHNKNDAVLGNLRGIDHLEDSPVGAAMFGSLGTCGIDVTEG